MWQLKKAGQDLIYGITIIEYNLKRRSTEEDDEHQAMTVAKSAVAEGARGKDPAEAADTSALELGELSELLGYTLRSSKSSRIFCAVSRHCN